MPREFRCQTSRNGRSALSDTTPATRSLFSDNVDADLNEEEEEVPLHTRLLRLDRKRGRLAGRNRLGRLDRQSAPSTTDRTRWAVLNSSLSGARSPLSSGHQVSARRQYKPPQNPPNSAAAARCTTNARGPTCTDPVLMGERSSRNATAHKRSPSPGRPGMALAPATRKSSRQPIVTLVQQRHIYVDVAFTDEQVI